MEQVAADLHQSYRVKTLLFGCLIFLCAFCSDAQTNISTEIDKLLPIGKCKVDIMGLAYPKRFVELSEKLQIAISTNRNWFLDYIKKYAKYGEPLPYSPKFGLTKEEYTEYGSLGAKCTLEKTGDAVLQVNTNAVGYEFDGGSTLADLTGLIINPKDLTITTPFTVLKDPTPEKSKGNSALGAFSGYQWDFDKYDLDKGDSIQASFLIGKLKESGREFIYYKGNVIISNNSVSDITIVIFYDRK